MASVPYPPVPALLWSLDPPRFFLLCPAFSSAMSASSDQGLISTCLAAGATECLVKPVTKKEVQQMWQHVWRRQQRSTSTSLLQGHLATGHLQGHLLVSGSDMEQMKHAAPFARIHDMVRRQHACLCPKSRKVVGPWGHIPGSRKCRRIASVAWWVLAALSTLWSWLGYHDRFISSASCFVSWMCRAGWGLCQASSS